MSEAAITRGVVAAASARVGRIPALVIAGIGVAWAVALAVELGGVADAVHHDSLLGSGVPGLAAFAGFLLAWQLMIVAMMLPSSLPLVRLFARSSARQPHPGAAMGAFLGGYALVWTAFGVLALALDFGLHRAVESSAWLDERQWLLAGAALALAGVFQFTKLKDACLDKCRHPAQFLTRYYERGVPGGLRLGVRHGAFCVGCCWALMLVLFAAGMASLVWMALLTALMLHEKTRPLGGRAVPVTGVALLAAASVVLAWSAYSQGAL